MFAVKEGNVRRSSVFKYSRLSTLDRVVPVLVPRSRLEIEESAKTGARVGYI
jgi:hypothetical protein